MSRWRDWDSRTRVVPVVKRARSERRRTLEVAMGICGECQQGRT